MQTPTVNQLLEELAAAYSVEQYDPLVHVTYKTLMERLKISDAQAKKILNEKAETGELKKVDIRHDNGKPGVAFRKP